MSAFRIRLTAFGSACAASIRRTFPAHLPLYICAVLFTAATAATTYVYDAPLKFEASIFFLVTVPKFMAVGILIAAFVQYIRLAIRGSSSPLRDFGDWAYRCAVAFDRPGNVVHSLITITP